MIKLRILITLSLLRRSQQDSVCGGGEGACLLFNSPNDVPSTSVERNQTELFRDNHFIATLFSRTFCYGF